jgi:hypothetical protein
MKTPVACPWFAAAHSNNGAHGLFFYGLVLLALFMVYNIAGMIYNRRKHRLYGLEGVPHIYKWRMAPIYVNRALYIVFDRIMISFAFAKGLAKRKLQGYRKM